MPRTYQVPGVSPLNTAPPGARPELGDIAITTDGKRWERVGFGDSAYDWTLEGGQPSAGDPYRTAGVPDPRAVAASDSDPHRRWLLSNHDWAFEEMDWSDKQGAPTRIRWKVDDAMVELRTNALGTSFPNDHLFVFLPTHGIRSITVHDRNAGETWNTTTFEAEAAWWVQHRTDLRTGKDQPNMRRNAEVKARAFIGAYREIVSRRSAPT